MLWLRRYTGPALDFAGEDEGYARAPMIRSEPRLDDQRTAGTYVPRHAGDRGFEAAEGLDDANRAEQAGDDVVSAAEIEIGHVGAGINAQRVLEPRSAQIAVIDIGAIDGVVLLEEAGVLAGAAGNIEDGAGAGDRRIDQGAEAIRFAVVVLEAVDGVVKFGAIDERVATHQMVWLDTRIAHHRMARNVRARVRKRGLGCFT